LALPPPASSYHYCTTLSENDVTITAAIAASSSRAMIIPKLEAGDRKPPFDFGSSLSDYHHSRFRSTENRIPTKEAGSTVAMNR
jgi:hypothetical protein